MDNINITLEYNAKGELVINAASKDIGSQFDNRAKQLVFTLPDGREDDHIVLYFKNSKYVFGALDIGTDRLYEIPNSLTQETGLTMQIGLAGGERLEHTDQIALKLRASLPAGQETPDKWPQPVVELKNEAFAGARYENDVLSFTNSLGEVVEELTVAGGGGTVTDNSITPNMTTFLSSYDGERVNLFDKISIRANGYYSSVNGAWTTSATASSSSEIPASPGDEITFKCNVGSGYHITYWTSDKQFISGIYPGVLAAGAMYSFTIPANAAYFRLPCKNDEIDVFMVVKNRSYPSRYWAYDELLSGIALGEELRDAIGDVAVSNTLTGKKLGVVGDSIAVTGYKADGCEYPAQIAKKNAMQMQNIAVSGSMITKSSVSGHTADHMCERVTSLDADCDFVLVAGGVNDMRNSIPLGSMGSDDITTFYGALDLLCRNLIGRFPDKPKALITPIKCRGKNNALEPYVSAIIEVCRKYSIPVFNAYDGGDLQPDVDSINTAYFYQGDGIHPNRYGHEILGRKIERFLYAL